MPPPHFTKSISRHATFYTLKDKKGNILSPRSRVKAHNKMTRKKLNSLLDQCQEERHTTKDQF